MANDDVLGPKKTMFVLVIVVGCFAVLWPRLLSPLLLGSAKQQLEPNQFDREAAIKQERTPVKGMAPHPALRERGRAIPAGAPTPPSRGPVPLPPHARVRTSPLSVYFGLEIDVVKPPPIPGMRPPLGSPGGPVTAPKSSMGFVMPIYTICIIVFFVYTLSKILFKRTGPSPYESISPDPQFRRRVFREDSRASPEAKLGHKERDARDVEMEALRARLADTERAMQRIVEQLAHKQADAQDNRSRPYTNGTVINNTGPVHIIASEYVEPIKEKSIELETIKEQTPPKESTPPRDPTPPKDLTPPPVEPEREPTPEPNEPTLESEEPTPEHKEATPEPDETTPESKEQTPELKEPEEESADEEIFDEEVVDDEPKILKANKEDDLIKKFSEKLDGNNVGKVVGVTTEDFLNEARKREEKKSTPELLEEALKEDGSDEEELEEEVEEEKEEEDVADEKEKSSVKVLGMETTAHAADGGAWRAPPAPALPAPSPPRHPHVAADVKSIYLETEIPRNSQARLIVSDFKQDRSEPADKPSKHAPLVVSGKMTLSLIQDAPRDTPERELESTVDEFTTASGITQPAGDNQELSDEEEEIEEEIEIEEIEEELEEDEEEPPKTGKKHA